MTEETRCPPDKGLGEPKMAFEDTFSAEAVVLHHFFPDKYPAPSLPQEPAWTSRLAHVQQWTPIERQCAYLKDEIEGLGAHPLLTDALNAVDLAMRTLGKWHDDGEPGRSR